MGKFKFKLKNGKFKNDKDVNTYNELITSLKLKGIRYAEKETDNELEVITNEIH